MILNDNILEALEVDKGIAVLMNFIITWTGSNSTHDLVRVIITFFICANPGCVIFFLAAHWLFYLYSTMNLHFFVSVIHCFCWLYI